jgi:hypothetical protein
MYQVHQVHRWILLSECPLSLCCWDWLVTSECIVRVGNDSQCSSSLRKAVESSDREHCSVLKLWKLFKGHFPSLPVELEASTKALRQWLHPCRRPWSRGGHLEANSRRVASRPSVPARAAVFPIETPADAIAGVNHVWSVSIKGALGCVRELAHSISLAPQSQFHLLP